MFTLVFIYLICIFLIWWGYAGYIFFLLLYYLLRYKNKSSKKIRDYPQVSVIIPCYNEENLIENKIKNLQNLVYPKEKINFIFADGGSLDNTIKIIKKNIKAKKNYKLIISKKNDKTNQVNKALLKTSGDIIVLTDVDAILSPKTIKVLVNEFLNNKKIGVVGALVVPQNSSDVEKDYWQKQNQLRLLESQIYSSSSVVAPCYAFRRSILKNFPEDCIADDIYITFLSQLKGYLVKYISNVLVYETRVPKNLLQFFSHKFRKANAYMIELLRFVYALNRFNPRWKIIFISRFLQMFFLPVILVLFGAISLNLFIINNPYRLAVVFILLFLIINILIASFLLNQTIFQIKQREKVGKFTSLKVFLYSNLILFFAIFTYFFFNQTSSYEKISQE